LVIAGSKVIGSEDKKIQDPLARLQLTFGDQLFGEPNQVLAGAKDLTLGADDLVRKLRNVEIDDSMCLKILKDLCVLADQTDIDYDSARQIAWAFRVIWNEWDPTRKKVPSVITKLAGMDKQLMLGLPKGRNRSSVNDELEAAFEDRASFSGEKFRNTLRAIGKLLP